MRLQTTFYRAPICDGIAWGAVGTPDAPLYLSEPLSETEHKDLVERLLAFPQRFQVFAETNADAADLAAKADASIAAAREAAATVQVRTDPDAARNAAELVRVAEINARLLEEKRALEEQVQTLQAEIAQLRGQGPRTQPDLPEDGATDANEAGADAQAQSPSDTEGRRRSGRKG